MKFFVFLILVCCASVHLNAQTDIAQEVRTSMAKGNSALNKRDTLSAIEHYKKALELNPSLENVRDMLKRLESIYSAKKNVLTEEMDSKIVKHVAEPEIPMSSEYADSVSVHKTIVQDTAKIVARATETNLANSTTEHGRSRFYHIINNNRSNNAGEKVLATPTEDDTMPAPSVEDVAAEIAPSTSGLIEHYSNEDDKLLNTLLFNNSSVPVYAFCDTPVSAFSDKLKTKDSDIIQSGKWISSVYGGAVIPQQMLAFEYREDGNELVVSEPLSALSKVMSSVGAEVVYIGEVDPQANMSLDCNAKFDAQNRDDMEKFISNVLSPFFGKYYPANLSTYRWMNTGTLTYDTIYSEIAIPDTVEVVNSFTKNTELNVKDSIVSIATISPVYIRDESYPLRFNIHVNAHPSNNMLSSMMNISIVLQRKNDEICIIKEEVPCVWYKIDDEDFLTESAKYVPQFAADTLKDFDLMLKALYSDRKMDKPEAFYKSAVIMNHSARPDKSALDNWVCKAVDLDNSDAMVLLGQMKSHSSDSFSNSDEAITLFENALNAGNGQAPLMMAIQFAQGDDMTKAFMYALESAKMNNIYAMQMIAEMYFSGIGIKRKTETAISWLKRRDGMLRKNRNNVIE